MAAYLGLVKTVTAFVPPQDKELRSKLKDFLESYNVYESSTSTGFSETIIEYDAEGLALDWEEFKELVDSEFGIDSEYNEGIDDDSERSEGVYYDYENLTLTF